MEGGYLNLKKISMLLVLSMIYTIFCPLVGYVEDWSYENLPDGGLNIISNDQFMPTFGEVDWWELKNSVVQTEKGRTMQIQTKAKKDTILDTAITFNVHSDFEVGDVGVISFWGRSTASTLDKAYATLVYQKNSSLWNKLFSNEAEFTSQWKRYNLPIYAKNSLPASTSQFLLWVAYEPQTIQIADFSIVNYKNLISYEALTGYPVNSYKGREESAQWRQEALQRIEENRTADINVIVQDNLGNGKSNIDVDIDMTKSAFNFGTAVTELLWKKSHGYSDYDCNEYRRITEQYFNTAVLEGAMKWEEYSNNNGNDSDNIVAFLEEKDMRTRGHCLYWDMESWFNIAQGSTVDEKKNSILNHVVEVTQRYPDVIQWDVLNEPTYQRFLRTNPNYGMDFIAEIFNTASANTDAKLYINELGITGNNSPTFWKIIDMVKELKSKGVKVDGVGLETHCDNSPGLPEEYYNQLNEIGKYVDEIAVTEYDINDSDQQLVADNLRDMLIVAYSHPKVNSFLIWGFWDKKHWFNNAPLFNADWSKKPAAYVWEDLVLNQWKTKKSGKTNSQGSYNVRGHLGLYDITVTIDGISYTSEIDVNTTSGQTITFDISTRRFEPSVTKEEILTDATSIVANDNLVAIASGSTPDSPNSVGRGSYYYQNFFSKYKGIQANLAGYNGYNRSSEAKISIPVSTDIGKGDILLVSFVGQKIWTPNNTNAPVQFGISNNINSYFSALVDIDDNAVGDPQWALTKEFTVPIVAERDFSSGSYFDIYLGFANYQSVFIGNLNVKNVGNSYSLSQVKNAFGLGSKEVYISGIVVNHSSNSVTFSACADCMKNVTYSIAFYQSDILVNLKVMENEITEPESKNFSAYFSGEFEFDKIKIFALDDLVSITPVSNYIEYKK